MPFESFPDRVRQDIPLAPYTWLQLGGPAKYFVEPSDGEQLTAFIRYAHEKSIPARVLGGGSNLLIRDKGFDGLVLHLSAPGFNRISVSGNTVTCGGGVKLSHLITTCVGHGLGGLEHLVGIPGTVGGALRSNSSTDEGDIGSKLTQATLINRKGEIQALAGAEANFSHRKSSLDELAIVEATFELQPGDVKQLTKREQTFWILKRSKQPNTPLRSALAFVDLDGVSASELIHRSGVSGMIEGNAQLNPSYPNYITVNTGGTAEHVLQLLDRAQKTIREKTGFLLQPNLVVW